MMTMTRPCIRNFLTEKRKTTGYQKHGGEPTIVKLLIKNVRIKKRYTAKLHHFAEIQSANIHLFLSRPSSSSFSLQSTYKMCAGHVRLSTNMF
jgi:hypothetical protein